MKKRTFISLVALLTLSVIATCVTIVPRYKKTYMVYEDVCYDWDDDNDRYDLFVDNKHYYTPTESAIPLFLPEDNTRSVVVLVKKETILHTRTIVEVYKFYINFGWKVW